MTREEEKNKARFEYVSKRLANPDYPTYNDEYELECAYDAGCVKGYEQAIKKACEWLRVELDKEEERHYVHVHGFDKERREIFLEDFRKAMKGE